ncbi:MAG: phosphopentomutase [Armatimonas sp.]
MIRRFFLLVLDGCGAGALPDAAAFGEDDPISNTLSNTARAVGGLKLPCLESLGFGNITPLVGVTPNPDAPVHWGRLREISQGKDTVTGHWEMMGIVTDPAFPTYPNGFPPEVIQTFEASIGCKTIGNFAASGTEILKTLGAEHVRTGFPIVYTSADSVFQVAAHADPAIFGLERLYDACEKARALLTPPNHICRVIARPFAGTETFSRTQNRKDWPLPPPSPTTLDTLAEKGIPVRFIGKTCELFPEIHEQERLLTTNNPDHCAALTEAVQNFERGFVFANLEDFDMLYGHRNDPIGFARLLEEFDAWLGADFLPHLRPGDLVGITADHGNDPTTPSTDHSREFVPRLVFGPSVTEPRALGEAEDMRWWGQEVLRWLV